MPFRERNYRNLKVWVAAHGMVLSIYRVTRRFPSDERYGLAAQLRRAAISIAANLAEGTSRSSDPGFAQFVEVAYGSATETDYDLLLARDLDYLSDSEYHRLQGELDESGACWRPCAARSERAAAQRDPSPCRRRFPLTANR